MGFQFRFRKKQGLASSPLGQFGSQTNVESVEDPDSFKLMAESQKQLTEVASTAREVIQAHYTDPLQLARFMESHQTPVFVLRHRFLGAAALMALGFEPGFIPPGQGKRFQLLLQLLNTQGHRPASHPASDAITKNMMAEGLPQGVIVLTEPLMTAGYLSHQLHHWLAFRAGLPGYSERAQHLYRQFWQRQNGCLGQEIHDMSVEDLLALKSAINRDKEALQFLRTITAEIFRPAQQARRLNDGFASA